MRVILHWTDDHQKFHEQFAAAGEAIRHGTLQKRGDVIGIRMNSGRYYSVIRNANSITVYPESPAAVSTEAR
jgi:hypothetical protein